MQLDKTRIAIRERGVADSLDLALHVLRVYFRPLVITMALAAIPMALLNEWLLGWMVHIDPEEPLSEEIVYNAIRYVWTMTLLITLEAPLASVFATTYLGRAVFMERPLPRTVLRDVTSVLGRLIWCQFLLRGVLPALLLVAMIDRNDSFSGCEVLLMLLTVAVCMRRSVRPFMNEIILLERNPLRGDGRKAMTIGRRSALLHPPSGGDLAYRWMLSAFYAVLLALALFGAITTLQGVFLGKWSIGFGIIHLGLPLALWMVAGFFTVARFLNYLDLRIRHEGWEVELRMRAEGARLAESIQ